MSPLLRTARLLLRAPAESDLDALARILSEPEVARWWSNFGRDRVRAELIAPDPERVVLAIEHEGAVVGAIQFSEEADPMYRHAGIDVFLCARVFGRGFGPEAIRAVVEHLFRDRGHHRLVIDPAAGNVRAIRAYEKVGFRRVGVMREYERGPDGTFHDGVLMELLAREWSPT